MLIPIVHFLRRRCQRRARASLPLALARQQHFNVTHAGASSRLLQLGGDSCQRPVSMNMEQRTRSFAQQVICFVVQVDVDRDLRTRAAGVLRILITIRNWAGV